MMIDLEGKVAFVTGASRGIGAGIAECLGRLGARVAILDVDDAALEEEAARFASAGLTVLAFPGSVSHRGAVHAAVAEVRETWGAVDILVNNAGIIRDNRVEKISESDWDEVLGVNLKGAFICCQSVVPDMRTQRYGRIVNIASRSWLGNIGQSNYAASKGGLVSLTRTLALELARDRITVNAIAPGLIDTPMTRGLPEEVRRRRIAAQPGGEIGTVDDVAAAVAFLVSDRARYITGQVLHVDGGMSCGALPL